MNKYSPECPFCRRYIGPPDEMRTEFGSVLGGSCECGAVYVYDPTGHNTGEAYMEALALAKGNWQIGGIEEEVDYESAGLDYDSQRHQAVAAKGQISMLGRLVFIKLKVRQDENFLTPEQSPADRPCDSRTISPARGEKPKDRLRVLLESRACNEAAEMARRDRGVIRWLISLAYDKEDVITWRAIETMGVISRTLSKEMPDVIRDTIRRLLWSMGEESGGIGWSAPEMLGEIISGDPDAFDDIIPILWSFKGEEMFRAGIVWAMGRVAMVRPEFIAFIMPELAEMLADANPVVRGYAIRAAGFLQAISPVGGEQISKLMGDISPVPFYENGELLTKTVRELAEKFIHKAPK